MEWGGGSTGRGGEVSCLVHSSGLRLKVLQAVSLFSSEVTVLSLKPFQTLYRRVYSVALPGECVKEFCVLPAFVCVYDECVSPCATSSHGCKRVRFIFEAVSSQSCCLPHRSSPQPTAVLFCVFCFRPLRCLELDFCSFLFQGRT